MQISPTTPIIPADRPATPAPDVAAAKAWTPAPPIRPTIQDYIDIDRSLIDLRQP